MYFCIFENRMDTTSIIVNFTTWIKRDKFIEHMLESISNQTVKPSKVICWLSEEEYSKQMPETVKLCLQKGLINDVYWVPGSTKPYKRWETFRKNSDAYNFMIDDDIIYAPDYIEKMLAESALHPGHVIDYYYQAVDLVDGKMVYLENPHPEEKKLFLSGYSCFPPHTFPMEALEHNSIRNKYFSMCDDNWIHSWMLKKHIPLTAIADHNDEGYLNTIEGSQGKDNSIWYLHNANTTFGVSQQYVNTVNILHRIGAVKEGEAIWPQIKVWKYRTRYCFGRNLGSLHDWKYQLLKLTHFLPKPFRQKLRSLK